MPDQMVLERVHAAYTTFLESAILAVGPLAETASAIQRGNDGQVGEGDPWAEWDARHQAFRDRYEAAVQRSSSHTEKLQQLGVLEARVRELAKEATRTRELLATLASAEAGYLAARDEWLSVQSEQDALIQRECAALTERSGGTIRVGIQPFADSSAFVDVLRQGLSGSRVQGNKMEGLGEAITKAADRRASWLQILDDLENLVEFGQSPTEARPSAASLTAAGLTANDLDRIAQTLKPDAWLSLCLTPIASIPVYEFRAREGEYIPFENASAGQQATALLKTLLNQPVTCSLPDPSI